jgi:hypothetical protein
VNARGIMLFRLPPFIVNLVEKHTFLFKNPSASLRSIPSHPRRNPEKVPLSWVTIIWSMVRSACLALAATNWPSWCKEHTARMVRGVCAVSLIINFVFTPNLNYREVTSRSASTFSINPHLPLCSGPVESLDDDMSWSYNYREIYQ